MDAIFDEWWQRIGQSLDPDTEDVPWFDKRKDLARDAFIAGASAAMNYEADRETEPMQISFVGGRTVIACTREGDPFLMIGPRQ